MLEGVSHQRWRLAGQVSVANGKEFWFVVPIMYDYVVTTWLYGHVCIGMDSGDSARLGRVEVLVGGGVEDW